MRTTTRLCAATAALALLSACGGGDDPSAKAQSFEEALGMDQDSMLAREAKVQEKIRICMKAEGFDYIPEDPSQSRMQFKAGPDSESPATLRKEGYGITNMPKRVSEPAGAGGDNPNDAIREALSESDKEAYDIALFGQHEKREEGDRGAVIVRRQVGGKGGGPETEPGCAGKAQRQVPGGPEQFIDAMDELKERIGTDARMVAVEREWRECMTESGYDWDTPGKIRDYLFGKLEAALGGEDGEIHFDADMASNAAVTALHQEELTIAKADADCREETRYQAITEKVVEEAQQRYLDEHPNLGT
jgi:hypothetical protein